MCFCWCLRSRYSSCSSPCSSLHSTRLHARVTAPAPIPILHPLVFLPPLLHMLLSLLCSLHARTKITGKSNASRLRRRGKARASRPSSAQKRRSIRHSAAARAPADKPPRPLSGLPGISLPHHDGQSVLTSLIPTQPPGLSASVPHLPLQLLLLVMPPYVSIRERPSLARDHPATRPPRSLATCSRAGDARRSSRARAGALASCCCLQLRAMRSAGDWMPVRRRFSARIGGDRAWGGSTESPWVRGRG